MADEVEASGFTQDHGYVLAQKDAAITLDGYFETDSTAALNSPSNTEHLTVAYGNNALPAVGDITQSIRGAQSTYSAGSAKDGLQTVNATLKPAQGINTPAEFGVLLADATISANGNQASVDNGASSANGGVGYLHITALSAGDTITVLIEDSPDNAIWSTLITFTLDGSALAAERLTVGGTVDRYVRASYTVTGTAISFPIAAAFIRS